MTDVEESGQEPNQVSLSASSELLLDELHDLNVNLDKLNDVLDTVAQMFMVLMGAQAKRQGKPLEQFVQEGLSSLVRNLFDMLGVPRDQWPSGF